uniref:Spermine/spermidine synthase n=1 Tax=Kwoniella bestiolae CBS 10118 TaxID=1296100 RepID=A0A1B9G2S1_9TREE|nr:hypothetical protein I302_05112 [Kwoniella bestiolae CBS 10118]OCF25298.1 hypothetical protein I302_05112 [Kwoniella bestiolae CBS 10118]
MSKVSFKDQDTLISPDTSTSTPVHTAALTTATTAFTEDTARTDSETQIESDTQSEEETEPDSAIPSSTTPFTPDPIKGKTEAQPDTARSEARTESTETGSEEESYSGDSQGSSGSNIGSDGDEDSSSGLEDSSTDSELSHSGSQSEASSKAKVKKSRSPKEKRVSRKSIGKTKKAGDSTSATKVKNGDTSGSEDSELDSDTSDSQVDSPSTPEQKVEKARETKEGELRSSRRKDEDIKSSSSASRPKDKSSRKEIGNNSSEQPTRRTETGEKTRRRSKEKEKEEESGSASSTDKVRKSEDNDTSTEEEEEVTPPIRARRRSPRSWRHEMVRLISLYLVPVLLAIPTSLLLSLNIQLLTPLYNSMPLSLHTPALYVGYTIVSSLLYWYLTLSTSAKDIISARVCFGLAALSGDVVAVYGRRIGMSLGLLFGPEYGAVAVRAVLGLGVVGGASGFTLLCFDHISPIPPATKLTDRPRNLGSILYRTGFYVFHIYTFERMWTTYLYSNVSIMNKDPEKTILFISLLLTAFSLLLRSSTSSTPFPTLVNSALTKNLKLSPNASKSTEKITKILPRQAFPLLLLLRIPLLILALRQQVFLRPPLNEPYVTANGELRLISSERSLTGQIVVAENLKDGYRFLRCDHSILGGRWIREVEDKKEKSGKRTEQGDSIFATFNLQEIAVLAHRSDPSESLIRTLQLTTDLEVSLEREDEDEKLPERALIIGLGVGIAASAFSRRGLYVDIVEIDPAVYLAAQNHFQLYTPNVASTNIMDGSKFVSQLAELKKAQSQSLQADNESEGGTVPTWDYVIQDCFTGGSVPGEMFTKEFWEDLGEMVKSDGIVAMNFAGVLRSEASRAVLVTLTSVFPQCRAFGDGFEVNQGPDDLVNMVVFCTKTYSPLLTFRPPTPFDGLRSPLRAHVYSTFHPNEIQLDDILSEADLEDPEMHLVRGQAAGKLNKWQVGSSLATWRAMKTSEFETVKVV